MVITSIAGLQVCQPECFSEPHIGDKGRSVSDRRAVFVSGVLCVIGVGSCHLSRKERTGRTHSSLAQTFFRLLAVRYELPLNESYRQLTGDTSVCTLSAEPRPDTSTAKTQAQSPAATQPFSRFIHFGKQLVGNEEKGSDWHDALCKT